MKVLFVIVARWIVALPAGLVSALLVMFPVHWAIMIIYAGGGNPDSMISVVDADGVERGCNLLTCAVSAESLERMAQAFVTPFVTLTVVARIVPSHRFQALAVLFVLYLVFFIGVLGLSVATGGGPLVGRVGFEGYSGWRWLEFVAVVAIGISGAVAPFYRQLQTWRDTR